MPIEIRELHVRVAVKDPPATAEQEPMLFAAADEGFAEAWRDEAIAQQEAMLAWGDGGAEPAAAEGAITFVGGWGSSMYQWS